MKEARQEHQLHSMATVWFRWGFALVWLTDAFLSLHPFYKARALEIFNPLGSGADLWMWGICLVELLMGLWLLLRGLSKNLLLFQGAFLILQTLLLGYCDPGLWAHPLGLISKNQPLLLITGVLFIWQREGISLKSWWLFRVGLAVIWFTEGLFPKILFQQQWERTMVSSLGLDFIAPWLFLMLLGVLQILSGLATLLLQGHPLRLLLWILLFALVALPVLVLVVDLHLLAHPFGPLIKNIPIGIGTYLILRGAVHPDLLPGGFHHRPD